MFARWLLSLSIILTAITSTVLGGEAKPFAHPGILHTGSDLVYIRGRIKAGAEPWKSAFEQLTKHELARLDYKIKPVAEIVRGAGNNPDQGASNMERAAASAYAHALVFALNGDENHAKKSAEILNAYAGTLKSIGGHDAPLLAGMSGINFINAAEILRHTWNLWPKEDQSRFEAMMRDIFYPQIKDFLPWANGNWGAAMIQTAMALGIFLDDHAIFDRAVKFALEGEGNGAINKYFNAFGECQESGRDQAHTQMGLGYLGCVCEIAWNQGIDLYGAHGSRLLVGYEYTAKYNLGEDVRYEPYKSIDGRYFNKTISDKSRGKFAPIYERVYHHYHDRLGLAMPYVKKVIDQNRPEQFSLPYSNWGTLMVGGLAAPVAVPLLAPVKIRDDESAVWQFSVPVNETGSVAYLYIRPDLKEVRGVLIALDNLIEKSQLEDAQIRAAAGDSGLAIVWISRGTGKRPFDIGFKIKSAQPNESNDGDLLNKILADLARESGYSELADAPLLSLGHSAGAPFAWELVKAWPQRMLGAIVYKSGSPDTPAKDGPSPVEGVPALVIKGQFEEWFGAKSPTDRQRSWKAIRRHVIDWRKKSAADLHGYLLDTCGGHFESTPEMNGVLALFIRKAAHARLPVNPADKVLRTIAPESGWLTDTVVNCEDGAPVIAAFADYKGERAQAFWYFDREMAEAARSFGAQPAGRVEQQVTFTQDGKLLPLNKRGIVEIPFRPLDDGRTFKLGAGFFAQIPDGLTDSGIALGHSDSNASVFWVKGPVVPIGNDGTFRVKFDYAFSPNKNNDVWLIASHPGDGRFRHSVQAGVLNLPGKLTAGKPQKLTFPDLRDVPSGTAQIELRGTTDSGLPVDYIVVSGPAIVMGSTLKLLPIPPRSRYPVAVTVTAMQWGRTVDPIYQSAETVTRTFHITK